MGVVIGFAPSLFTASESGFVCSVSRLGSAEYPATADPMQILALSLAQRLVEVPLWSLSWGILRCFFERHDTLLKSVDRVQRVGQTASRKPYSSGRCDQRADLDGFAVVLRPEQSLLQEPLKDYVDEEPTYDG
jgi:hypothetical protein